MPRRWVAAAAGGLAVTLLAAPPVQAQGTGRGFLFNEPVASFSLRGGFDRAMAGSDVFSFATRQLTLDRGDFSALTVGADLSFRVAPRIDVVFGGAYAGASAPSEFRDFVDQDDLPIEQTTSFQRVPLMASVKAYLTPRGRSIGRFAWVPARYAPYLGAGGGAMWYRFRQQGDFIDFETDEVFGDDIASSGWTPMAHALAGLDYSLSPRVAFTGEGRYAWARANLSDRFEGFDRIDLSGFTVTAGVSVRF